jgi:DNA-binding CsgD family transcriptional regulator
MMELLERGEALQTLQQQLKCAGTRGGIALVCGEAGIGKSTLLRVLAQSHAAVWWGRCDALCTPHPLAPLLDIARDAKPRFSSRLAQPRPVLFDAVLDELRVADTPVLFVVEDVHWADEATLDLLKFVGRRIDSAKALLAITFRDDELSATHPLRRLLGDLPSAFTVRLGLARLSEQAVCRLAQQAQRPVDGVYEATRGNPLFVTELLRDGASTVPGTVQDLVLARYARLSGPQQAVLRVVALVPSRTERWLLDALVAPSAQDLEACLDSGLLQVEGPYLQFRHELARVAIEASMLPPVAQALHRQLLAAMAARERTVPVARLAHHAALAYDEDAVRRFAPAAAEEAAARGALREAARHWQAALRCTPTAADDPLRQGWLEAQAIACRQLACLDEGLEARKQLDEAFRRAGDIRKQALNLSLTANLLALKTHNTLAEAISAKAMALLAELPPGPELATVHGVEASLRLFNREYTACLHWCEQSLATARRFGDRDREMNTHATAVAAAMFLDYANGCAKAVDLLAVLRAQGQHATAVMLLTYMGAAAHEQMHLQDAAGWLHEAVSLAAEHELDGSLYYAQALLSHCELRRGDWDQAADRASMVVGRPGVWPISRAMALVTLGSLRFRRGDPGAEGLLTEVSNLVGGSQALQRIAPVRALQAEAAWLRKDAVSCASAVHAALASAQQRQHPWFTGELAAWCRRAGILHEAPPGCALPYALEIEGRWREAALQWQQLGCPYEEANVLAQGDAPAQQRALAMYDTLGALPAADALRRRMRQAGLSGVTRGVRESTRGHPCGLTRAEMHVLALMAQDLRNADIAQRLHRSVRTVDHHVAAVLSKLQVGSRHEAVRRAQREKWVDGRSQSGHEAAAS